jgi:hypothetical protein
MMIFLEDMVALLYRVVGAAGCSIPVMERKLPVTQFRMLEHLHAKRYENCSYLHGSKKYIK